MIKEKKKKKTDEICRYACSSGVKKNLVFERGKIDYMENLQKVNSINIFVSVLKQVSLYFVWGSNSIVSYCITSCATYI